MPERTVPSDAVLVMNQEFRVDRACRLDVQVPGARLRLRDGQSDDRVVVSVSVAGCSDEEANEVLERIRLSTRQVQDRVQVVADEPVRDADYWRWLRDDDTTLYLDLALPPNTDAEISVPSGELYATGLHGDIDIIAAACPVEVSGIGGSLRITSNGEAISVEAFSGDELRIDSTGAAVEVTRVEARTVALRCSAGTLTARDIRGAVDIEANGTPVTLTHIDGSIRGDLQASPLTLDGVPASGVDLRATGGPITASLPPSLSADVLLEGSPVELDPSLSFQGDVEEQRAEGVLNSGGAPVTLRAIPGTVRCVTER